MTRLYILLFAFCSCLVADVPHRAIVGGAPISARTLAIDDETVAGLKHFTRGYPADHPDGSVNAVIEIPAGTVAKFEVSEIDGMMRWKKDRETGGRREIDYLPFLVNYGSVPRTLSPDGDPIDIVVLCRGIERGHVARVRVIGVLKMRDDGDVADDKLIAVPLDPAHRNGFSRLHDLPELDEYYADVRTILWTWFASYWGPGVTRVVGWGDAAEAHQLLEDAKRAFTEEPGVRPLHFQLLASHASLAASALHLAAPRPSGEHAR